MLAARRSLITVVLLLCVAVAGAAHGQGASAAADVAATDRTLWSWPLDATPEVVAPFRAPAHAFGAGHRGVDIAAQPGQRVRAPASGVVAFRGTVVDRPLLTVDHGDGHVSTYEPVSSTLNAGDRVAVGDALGEVAAGGHSASGTMHLGVRLDGMYIDPMLLFGSAERAILLPCCTAH